MRVAERPGPEIVSSLPLNAHPELPGTILSSSEPVSQAVNVDIAAVSAASLLSDMLRTYSRLWLKWPVHRLPMVRVLEIERQKGSASSRDFMGFKSMVSMLTMTRANQRQQQHMK